MIQTQNKERRTQRKGHTGRSHLSQRREKEEEEIFFRYKPITRKGNLFLTM
jgi:hypothetical protein